MTGRAAVRILNGAQGRGIARALAAVTAGVLADAPPIAADQVACPTCRRALRFEPDVLRGEVFEYCDTCRTRRRVERRTPDQVREDPARHTPEPVAPRLCERCGQDLGVWKRGRRGGRPPRLCKDRRACARRELGVTALPRVRRGVSVRQQVLAALPAPDAPRLSSSALHALLPKGTELSTVRVALYELHSAGLIARVRDGLRYLYWRIT